MITDESGVTSFVPINLPAFLDTDTYWNTTIVKETTNDGGQKETCKSILPCCASDNCVMTGTLLSEKASQFSQN